MPRRVCTVLILSLSSIVSTHAEAPKWPAPVSPAVPEADGYVVIPNAAVPPSRSQTYKAVFDATQASGDPKQLLPALNMLGSELNALRAAGVPDANAKFVVAFHGAAVKGLLKDELYKAEFGVANPNLPVLRKLRALGVELYVCG